MPTPTIAIDSVLQLYVLNVATSTVAMWLAAWLTALHATLFQIGMAMLGAALAGLLPGFSGWQFCRSRRCSGCCVISPKHRWMRTSC
ncbi:hypothetical protein [Metallibacterium scheffleri]|nr:hypothetical protein [Metallibacterium scheffleri]